MASTIGRPGRNAAAARSRSSARSSGAATSGTPPANGRTSKASSPRGATIAGRHVLPRRPVAVDVRGASTTSDVAVTVEAIVLMVDPELQHVVAERSTCSKRSSGSGSTTTSTPFDALLWRRAGHDERHRVAVGHRLASTRTSCGARPGSESPSLSPRARPARMSIGFTGVANHRATTSSANPASAVAVSPST